MRYRYVNKAYRAAGSKHGELCDPVYRPDGKCWVGGGKQVVRFEDGVEAVVIRRCLRLNSKLNPAGDAPAQ